MNYLGYIFLVAAILSSFFKRVYLNLSFVLLSISVLILGYITNNFSFESVYFSSHENLKLIYKLSALWTTNEGSMLLWVLILSIYTSFFNFYIKNLEIKVTTIKILCFVNIVFLLFILYSADPFKTFKISPEGGVGLNPILQDVALTIHPPILYLGYVGCVICFAFAIAILIEKNYKEENFQILNKFCLITFTFLSFGVFLGCWWSYRELGWGGFWAWDPVENVSLMPWLIILAAIHSLVAVIRHKNLKFLSLFLCIVSFLASILGTFITRSGIIDSVHSFANDQEQGIYIFIIFILFSTFSLGIFFNRFIKFCEVQPSLNNKVVLLIMNNIVLITLFVILLIGLLSPIFIKLIFERKIYISEQFYNNVFSYFVIPLTFGVVIFPALSGFLKKYKFSLLLLLPICIYSVKNFTQPLIILINITSLALMTMLTENYFRSINRFNIISLLKNKKNGFFLSHFSFGLFLFGVTIFVSQSVEIKKYFKPGDIVKMKNLEVELKNYEIIENKNFSGVRGIFKVQQSRIMKPEFRIDRKSVV